MFKLLSLGFPVGCRKLDISENYSPLKVVHRAENPVQKEEQGFFFSPEKTDAGEYCYGFNGMERDDEVAGEGNSYTTHFRSYDARIARWTSIDPLAGMFAWQSSYAAFDNNPVYYTDPSGAAAADNGDGDEETGTVTATVYLKFDSDAGHLTPEEMQNYIDNFAQNVRNDWNSYVLSNGVNVNVNQVEFLMAPEGMTQESLENNENLLVVGFGASASPDAINGVSYVNMGGLNNTGYMYYKSNPTEASHEFGHLLGLKDRYYGGLVYNIDWSKKMATTERYTLPAIDVRWDKNYDYKDNLMSGSGSSLTPKQLTIAFNQNKTEKSLKEVSFVHSSTVLKSISPNGIDRRGLYASVHGKTKFSSRANYKRSNLSGLNQLYPDWLVREIRNSINLNNYY